MNGPKPHHSKHKVHWIMDFAREERVRQGLTQTDFSETIEFTMGHLSNYETGYYTVRAIYAVERILNGLGYHLRIHKIPKRTK